MNHNPKITVLIVTWNRQNDLQRCIDSVLNQSYTNFEIVVVDNNSSDNTVEIIKTKYPQIIIIENTDNLGCPSARNVGFKHSTGDYIYSLDDDGWLDSEAIEKAVACATKHNDAGIITSVIHEISDGKIVKHRPDGLKETSVVGIFSGGCSMMKAEALNKTGYYPDDFFRQGEESDLVLRMMENEYICIFEPTSIMYHAASPVGRSSKTFIYYNLRNSNKTGLRLWPFPFNILRLFGNFGYSLKYMLILQYFILPCEILRELCIDISTIANYRKPVSLQTFLKYRNLLKNPEKLS